MLVRLFDPVVQFQNKGGALNTAGRLEVYLEGTDDLAQIYSDEEGHVPLSQPVILDNNGRSRGLYVESGVKYRLAVHTNHGALLFTVRNMVPVGGGGGGGQSLSASLPLKIEGGTITNNGTGITCTGENAWAEGHNTTASGEHSHAEGSETIASGANSHAEGAATKATHPHTHAEGFHTEATATGAHAEGSGAKATTVTAHAEGQDTVASGAASHAQGRNSVASGAYSHASGYGTRATGEGSHAVGKYNDDGSALFVVGNGSGPNGRKDVFKVDSNEDTWVMIGGVLTKVTNVSGGGGGGGGSDKQFMLVRSNMTTDFTNQEYQDCVDAITAERAVCVQFVMTGSTIQAQLTMITGGGTLIFEFTADRYHYRWEVAAANNAHTVELTGKIFGVPIFDTLQDAISNEHTLESGDVFETNGFHTSGDGGAARYYVSSSGTANGKNIIQLAAGKNAYLQYGDWIVPEQLGYQQSYSRDDVVPYITHAISIGCQHIHLRSSGNGAGYTWKTKLTVSVRGFKLTGEGDWGYPNKFSYIVFRPTENTVDAMVDIRARDVLFKDLDIEVTGDYVKLADGITSVGYDSDENRFWEIDNVRFNSFRKCIKFGGGIKWQNSVKNCLFNSCEVGLHLYESSTFELICENCLFTNCNTNDVLVEGNLFAATFTSCGFGSQGTAISLTVNSDQYMYQNIRFEGCNFEIDRDDLVNAPAIFIDCFQDNTHPYVRQNVTIANCHFTPIKASYPDQGTTNRYVRLGPKTNLLLISNQILGKDEPQHPTWVLYPKLIWNENSVPTYGSIVECGANTVGNGNFEYPDALLPYVTRNTQARSLGARGADSGSAAAWGNCNTWLPDYSGQIKVARVSAFENTSNMPTTGIFGYLYTMGVIDAPNPRVVQMLVASNGNIYTRRVIDVGNGWEYDPWKTITAS